MDARPYLEQLARLLHQHRLEAILIGNAAAALQGAPVTTVDIDFFFRKTPRNLVKLKALSRDLKATILRPYYPVSDLFRLSRDYDGLQVDFMAAAHGISSFESLKSRSGRLSFGDNDLLVASLADILKSKRAAGRRQDLMALHILEEALERKQKEADPQATPGTPQEGK